jgi:hypothetical protein
LTVRVKGYAVTGLYIPVLVKVSDEVVLNPSHGDEGGRVVRYGVLRVNCALKHSSLLGNGVLRVGNYRNPL